MESKRLFLLDAYALIFRAYYALIRSPRFTAGGFNTSAVFGFVNTLEELLRKERPTHLAVCFDPPGSTFRHKMLEDYKGERESTPEDIKRSVPVIKEIVKAYRIPIVEAEGYEADDVIGTLAKRAAGEGYTVYMMTPDKDFGQLVSPSVYQYKPSYRGQDFEVRGEKEVCERYGLADTSQVIDLLSLMGDKADNIPGCPGIGEKTAVKLISEFGSAENIIASSGKLKGALKRKIEEGAESIVLSKDLATIRTDVPVGVKTEDFRLAAPDLPKLFAIFKEMEFNTLRSRVEKRLSGAADAKSRTPDLFAAEAAAAPVVPSDAVAEMPEEKDFPQENFVLAGSAAHLEQLERRISECSRCGIHIFTDSADSDYAAKASGFGVAPEGAEETYFIPAGFAEGRAAFLDLLARPDIEKCTFSSRRDYVCASRMRGDDVPALAGFFDISLAHYLLQPELRHSPEELSSRYLSLRMPQPRKLRKGEEYTQEELMQQCCVMARAAMMLREPLLKEVEDSGLDKLMREIEFPLSPVLAEMELAGVRIDVAALDEAAARLNARIAGIESEICGMAGEEFNVGSPAKVGEILFGKLGLDPKAKKTRTGQYSTSEQVLERLRPKHPIVGRILEYRQLKKLVSTYLTALPEAIDPASGKIHTTYNQTATATGRISSSNPNLQNIPVRDEIGREVRRAFIPDPGCTFLSADYSQIELRLVADMSGDETMTDAFRHGKDIHTITAARIYGKNPEEITPAERRNAKTANFGILYGISAFGLSTRLNIPRQEAKMLIDGYHATFPAVSEYMENTLKSAREKGYVSTLMGRRRMQPDINSSNAVVRGYAERNAINAPIQGTAADVIKKAMIGIHAEMRRRGMKSRMIMQVHDELNFNVAPGEAEELRELVVAGMENAYSGNVRLIAECGTGSNWLEAH